MVRLVLLVLGAVCGLSADDRWDAKITLRDRIQVPFSFQFRVDKDGSASANWGDVRSTAGKAQDGKLTLEFASGARMEAKFDGGKSFEGDYLIEGARYRIEAAPFCTCGFQGEAGPDISGTWALAAEGGGMLRVRRTGDDTVADLELPGGERVQHLMGRFDGLSFALAAFDGRRGVLLDAEPEKDTLKITLQFPGSPATRFTATKRK